MVYNVCLILYIYSMYIIMLYHASSYVKYLAMTNHWHFIIYGDGFDDHYTYVRQTGHLIHCMQLLDDSLIKIGLLHNIYFMFMQQSKLLNNVHSLHFIYLILNPMHTGLASRHVFE